MNNQKKIEEILYSIQELILEAQNEEKLDRLQTSEIIELNKINQTKFENLKNEQDYKKSHANKLIKTTKFKIKDLDVETTNNNSYKKNCWKDLSFKKCQEAISISSSTNVNKDKIENELEKMFRGSLNFWIKENLPDLVKDETALFTKKTLEEKLK